MLLDGLVVSNGGGNAGAAGLGIYMSGNFTAEVYNCLIVSNYANVTGGGDGPGVHLVNGTAIFTNCVFDNNGSGAGSDNGGAVFIDSGIVSISNCTFAGNSCSGEGGAIAMDGVVVSISDCIFYTNEAPIRADSISVLGGTAFINYARMDGTNVTDDVYDAVAGLAISNVIFDAPSFASDSDYHLMSRAARWDPALQAWVKDSIQSACIDSGNPDSDYSNEPTRDGNRINLGAYGGTPHASETLRGGATVIIYER